MKKKPGERHGVFEDDDLDNAIANVDDTGMVKSERLIFEAEELEHLPPESESEEPEDT
jgi:hypothetical protein